MLAKNEPAYVTSPVTRRAFALSYTEMTEQQLTQVQSVKPVNSMEHSPF
jgi:hypothetical protein